MYLKARTLQQLWPSLLRHVMKEGRNVLDERGSETKELLNVVWTVEEPEESEDPVGNPFDGQKLEEYKNQLLDPELHGHSYSYGNRLRKHFKEELWNEEYDLDQIKKAIDRLKECEETRRATSITWDPMVDTIEDEVPCMILIDFKIRDGKLFTTALWRSQDCYGAIPANFFALRELARYVAEETNVKVGSITVQSISCHIYKINWKEAQRVIK